MWLLFTVLSIPPCLSADRSSSILQILDSSDPHFFINTTPRWFRTSSGTTSCRTLSDLCSERTTSSDWTNTFCSALNPHILKSSHPQILKSSNPQIFIIFGEVLPQGVTFSNPCVSREHLSTFVSFILLNVWQRIPEI